MGHKAEAKRLQEEGEMLKPFSPGPPPWWGVPLHPVSFSARACLFCFDLEGQIFLWVFWVWLLFNFFGERGTFSLRNMTLNMERWTWVFLMSRRSFPLCFSVFCTAAACCWHHRERTTQLVSSLDMLSVGSQNARLQTIYSSLGVDSLVSKMLILWSIWTIYHTRNWL